MRSQLRTGLTVGVAVALVLALPSLSSAQSAAREPGHARAAALLDRVGAALTAHAPTLAPGQVRPRTDLTLELRDLRRALPALTRSERATAESYLARPATPCGLLGQSSTQTSEHFVVHYCASGSGVADPSFVALTLAELERVWASEVGTLGFRPPPADGDGLFDVYLQQLADQGLYGYCATDSAAAHSTSYCVLDNDFATSEYGAPPVNSLRVTAAHEFFHAVQFGYDTGEDLWLMEGSAVWAEEQVYPQINDYLQYLRFSAITQPRVPADYKGITSTDLFFRYGAVLFWTFLSEHFRDPRIVRRVWEYADGNRYSLQAVSATLAERGWSFPRAFARFGVWNTRPPGSYGDRNLFPPPAWWLVTGLGRGHRSTGVRSVALDHLTNAAMVLRPAGRLPKRTRVRIRVDGPALARMPRATVQVRRVGGSVRVLEVPLDAAGNGTLGVGFDPRRVAALVVTLTNASTRMSCSTDSADRYSCGGFSVDDDLPFAVRARLRLP